MPGSACQQCRPNRSQHSARRFFCDGQAQLVTILKPPLTVLTPIARARANSRSRYRLTGSQPCCGLLP
ncbi:MAG: hypothetical protein U0401_31660 [Anaerolineae bacterium]